MRVFFLCIVVVFGWYPAASTALTMQELLVVLDHEQRVKIDKISEEFHPLMLLLMEPAMTLENAEDKYFAIDEMLQLFYNPSQTSVNNVINEYEYAGIPLSEDDRREILDFTWDMDLRYARQILATQAGIEQSRVALSRLRDSNLEKEEHIQVLRRELEVLRAEETELRAEVAQTIKLIEYIENEIAETQALIVDIEAMR